MREMFKQLIKGCLAVVLFASIVFAGAINTFVRSSDRTEFMANEVLLKIKENPKANSKALSITSQIKNVIKQSNIRQKVKALRPVFKTPNFILAKAGGNENFPPRLRSIYRVQFAQKINVPEVVQKLTHNPDVEYAEPNYILRACVTPNDSLFEKQWYLNNTGQYFLADADIDAPEAWDIDTGDSTVIVGVIDTGVDYLHPDLAGNVLSDGYDFPNQDADPMDDNGHGTHVAGIIAALSNNHIGISGIAWHAKILPVKVLNQKGIGMVSDVANGVIYAAQHNARVINLSLGTYAESLVLKDALETASGNAILVAAAGNDGIEYDDFHHPFYPASYDFVIGVGATNVRTNQSGTASEVRAIFSNYGVNADIYAPGVNIWSTFPEFHPLRHGYKSLSGTSMAAPIVSGVAALLRSHFPDWSNELIRGQIMNTAVEFSDGIKLNAYNALSNAIAPEISFASATVLDTLPGNDGDGIADAGETVHLVVEIENSWGPATNVHAVLRPHSVEDTTFVEIQDSSADLGNLSAYAHANNERDPYLVYIKSKTPNNQDVYFDVQIKADGGYQTVCTFHLNVQKGIEVGGVLSGNTTWSKDYLYIVTSNVLVPNGVRLTIEPGTVIRFEQNRYLRVDGELVAIGTPDNPIVFTSNLEAPQQGSYQGIKFTDSAVSAQFDSAGNYLSGSTIQYADVAFAGGTEMGGDGGGIFVEGCSPYFAHNKIHDNATGGLVLVGSDAMVEYNHVYNNGGIGGLRLHSFSGVARFNLLDNNYTERAGGIYVDNSTGIIENNIICRNYSSDNDGGGGMFVSGSHALIRHNVFFENQNEYFSGALSFSYEDASTFEFNTVINNRGGIAVGNSKPTIRFNNILHNHQPGFPYELQQHIPFGGSPSQDFLASNNYWGTTEKDSLAKWIWDFYDDFDLGKVNYDSALTDPVKEAPGFLTEVNVNPPSPVGSEVVQFELTFSAPMDVQIQPAVTFGVADPYRQHRVEGDWLDSLHWVGQYKVSVMTGDGINYVCVSGAKDKNGLEAPKDHMFSFVIKAMQASSTEFAAEAKPGYVELKWSPPQFTGLLGYNMYRFQQINDSTFSDTLQINKELITDSTYHDTQVKKGNVYFYMYTVVSTDFKESYYSSPVSVTALTGLEDRQTLPKQFALGQNYPNPFNPTTTIPYALPKATHVKMVVYDLLGRKVVTLINKNQSAGRYRVIWDASNVSSGIYFYSIRAGKFSQVRKMIVLH